MVHGTGDGWMAVAKPAQHRMSSLTFGIEEEFLLLDAEGHPVSRAPQILAQLPGGLRPYVKPELFAAMIEINTPICHRIADARTWLRSARRRVAAIAGEHGARLVSAGTPLRGGVAGELSAGERYAKIRASFGSLVDWQCVCALQVHVGSLDEDAVLIAANRIRPWLPVLQALTVNSPIYAGRDTGYASWRSILWAAWPTAGPAPWLGSAADYRRTLGTLHETGAILDARMIYWYARPSSRYPTLEIRAADACATVTESTLIAALSRALVATALTDETAGRGAARSSAQVLAVAHWTAARYGMTGRLLDAVTGQAHPAWDMAGRMLAHTRAALEAYQDLDFVQRTMAEIRNKGTGADRQRAAYQAHRDTGQLTSYLAAETLRD